MWGGRPVCGKALAIWRLVADASNDRDAQRLARKRQCCASRLAAKGKTGMSHRSFSPPFLVALLFALALVAGSAREGGAAPEPVHVFILAGQSNMEGQAVADLEGPDYNGGKGTLGALLRDPEKAPRFQHLRGPDGRWTVRPNVWVRYQREGRPLLKGPLTVGFTVYGDAHHFGPEQQFGHVIGDAVHGPVLLV